MVDNTADGFAEDKEAKKALVIDTITERCESSIPLLYKAINGEGSTTLEATILSGGITNYSYKVYADKHPDICVFAKLSFEFALWNPDTHH